MPNPIVHWEVTGKDGERLQSFFSDLFGWKVDASNPMSYGIIEPQDGEGIGGGISASQDGSVQQTFYVQVDDIEATLKKAGELGGKTVVDRTVIPGMVTFAQFQTPEGHVIGLVEPGQPEG